MLLIRPTAVQTAALFGVLLRRGSLAQFAAEGAGLDRPEEVARLNQGALQAL